MTTPLRVSTVAVTSRLHGITDHLAPRDHRDLVRIAEELVKSGTEHRSVERVNPRMNRLLLRHPHVSYIAHASPRLRLHLLVHQESDGGCTFWVVDLDGLSGTLAKRRLQRARARTQRVAPRAAMRTTHVAAALAGSRRPHLLRDWTAVLAGSPEDGVTLSSLRQFAYSLGFVCAALNMRARDVVRPLWRPIDWILSKSSRTNGLIAFLVGSQAIYIVGDAGLAALITEVWEPCAVAGAALYGLAHWLRNIRGIELPPRERQKADN
ncbi:hypothetical protein ACFYSF_35940 [Streptomyces canus]|uniref:hypothetical protein n=1 Tax=Streptomyces canus TaxID=58343 RepID=UPI00367F64EF